MIKHKFKVTIPFKDRILKSFRDRSEKFVLRSFNHLSIFSLKSRPYDAGIFKMMTYRVLYKVIKLLY